MSTPPSFSRTRTLRPSRVPPSVESSPIRRIDKYFVAHKRDEFQAFGYDETIHKPCSLSSTDFLDFLNFKTNAFRAPDTTPALSMGDFLTVANDVAAAIHKRHFPRKDLLVFRNTGNKALLGHVTDTECRPDIAAAFITDWTNETTHWSCAQLAGEQASKGKNKSQQEQNAISYLHYLLLARPDLNVAQGLLIGSKKITFLLGIGGCGIYKLDVLWNDTELYKLLYAFIYPLYDSDDFADKSYIRTKTDWIDGTVAYTIRIKIPSNSPDSSTGMDCTNFCAISAKNPFTARTHVLSNASFQGDVDGKALTVLKDRLCRAGTRFDEEMILSAIHEKGVVPGVVEAVHHETIRNRWSEVSKRDKHRFGLRQLGLPFMSIPTPRKVLEVLFDVLEVLRYLHSECHILHRDISAGNILYVENSSEIAGAPTVTLPSPSLVAGQVPVFIKYLLGDSNDQQTSILLIDFNCAELLNEKQSSDHQRTGTPIFIARAVETSEAVPLPDLVLVPAVPESPEIYASTHKNRIEKFPLDKARILQKPERDPSPWRHELEHDAESVFWLLLYWAMVAQPANSSGSPEVMDPGTWVDMLGQARSRNGLVKLIAQEGIRPGVTHSIYEPLGPLIKSLASILVVDRQWLAESDVRNDPAYISEAFQRLILQFMLDHHHQKFMNCEAGIKFCSVKQMPQSDALSATSSERLTSIERSAERKRRLSPLMDNANGKRRRLDVAQTEGAEWKT